MIELFKDVNIDWLGKRRYFIAVSVTLMLSGLASAMYRHAFHPGGTEAFNLGIDFKGGTVVTADFKQRPAPEAIRDALHAAGVSDPIIQPVTDKPGEVFIRLPQMENAEVVGGQTQVDMGRTKVIDALKKFGSQGVTNEPFPQDGNAYK